jgi:hypothetical protein
VIVGQPAAEASGNELDHWIAERGKDAH